jgi:hypothetical protein|nr:MAG TPA: hypothetical protein [Caudoviricetes sp.]
MNILTDRLPVSVMIGGSEIGLNADFRASITFETMLMENEGRSEEEIIIQALDLYYADQWKTLPYESGREAIEKMLWFYRCGRSEPKRQKSRLKAPPYSYDYDAPYIYAAFLEQYGIDLQKVDFLHWWKFRAMFDALAENTRIMEVIKIRAIELDGKMSKEQKTYYRKMKKIYELPRKEKSEEQKALEEILLNGGDISILDGKD